jgi:hypothetical protein
MAARLDEPADERPVLIERRAAAGSVLLEREREVGALVEVGEQGAKRPEAETPE